MTLTAKRSLVLPVTPATYRTITANAKRFGLARTEYVRRLLNWGWVAVNCGEETLELIRTRYRDRDRSGEAGQTAKQAGIAQ